MKKALKIASVLTWFNLVFWGLLVISSFLGALLTGQSSTVAVLVLLSAIPLNAFAALRLHASIRYSGIPLSHQTPVGIRFVGLVALFFGIMIVSVGSTIVGNPGLVANAWKDTLTKVPENIRSVYPPTVPIGLVRLVGGAMLALGLLVVINVILNLRLLRWYYLVHRSDIS